MNPLANLDSHAMRMLRRWFARPAPAGAAQQASRPPLTQDDPRLPALLSQDDFEARPVFRTRRLKPGA